MHCIGDSAKCLNLPVCLNENLDGISSCKMRNSTELSQIVILSDPIEWYIETASSETKFLAFLFSFVH